MNRPGMVILIFGSCLLVVLGVLGWVSKMVIDLETEQQEARARADLEEGVRLALWRMTGALSPLMHQESARPYFVYRSFYAPDQAYTKMFVPLNLESDEVLLPSRLLLLDVAEVFVHFQIAPDGSFSSPQVPRGNMRDLAESRRYISPERSQLASDRLSELQQRVPRDRLLTLLPAPTPLPPPAAPGGCQLTALPSCSPVSGQSVSGSESSSPRGNYTQQAMRNDQEVEVRNVLDDQLFAYNNGSNRVIDDNFDFVEPSAGVSEGLMAGVWVDQNLILARRVLVGDAEYLQGCWLDWATIKDSLLATVEDLLPSADLVPIEGSTEVDPARRISFIPALLVPGPAPVQPIETISSIRMFLLVAWGSGTLAALAVAVLLLGSVALSERRKRFVSAVTHELRTPLTTFRIYTEMLDSKMVPEAKKPSHIAKLRREADRLGHLVENVLAYSSLESSRSQRQVEPIAPAKLLERCRSTLEDRARQAGLELEVSLGGSEALPPVRADAGAVERILFNLVDNACKYANPYTEPRISIDARRERERVVIRVRDYGPGVTCARAKDLFQSFSKGDGETTSRSPGVGLGLALSRRLARDMGGELSFDENAETGAAFELSLLV